jgi:pimeloyl-ACP methyl ester carboxylesterase
MFVVEREVTVDSSGHRLSGTLCAPADAGRYPVVLMVHGSGPLDRDENMRGQQLNVFSAIAHHLAGHGLASLRYDKRGCGKSSGSYLEAGISDLVDDAAAWLDALAVHDTSAPGKLFVLGHSEGCIVAPMLSLRRPQLAGVILLCPFVEAGESLLLRQAAQLQREIAQLRGVAGWTTRRVSSIGGGPVASQTRLITRLKTSSAPTLRVGWRRVPAKALRELMSVDAPAMFRQVSCPMLVIGGDKDMQCNPADVDRIAELAGGPTEVHRLPTLTHSLRTQHGAPSILGTRQLLAEPVDPAVTELITRWLDRHT